MKMVNGGSVINSCFRTLNRSNVSLWEEALKRLVVLIKKGSKNSFWLVRELCAISDDLKYLSNIGAGPLEYFLSMHGEQFFNDVRKLASTNDNFLIALGSVWQNDMSSQFYLRIIAVLVANKSRLSQLTNNING